MTRLETLHLIADSQDNLWIHTNEMMGSASLHVGNVQYSLTLTLKLEHIPYIEQLLTALWVMKEDQDKQDNQARKQLEAMEKEWEDKQEYLTTAEF